MKYIPIILKTIYFHPMHLNSSQNQFGIAIPSAITNAKPPTTTSLLPPTTPTATNMAPAPTARTRTATKKKNETAADELQKQVALEKKKREEKKKQRAAEKRADEEKKKKSDQEKANATAGTTTTVSPPMNNDDAAAGSGGAQGSIRVSTGEGKDRALTPTDLQEISDKWTEAEDEETLAEHGISPNHLFGKDPEKWTGAEEEVSGHRDNTTVDLTAAENSPKKKKSKNAETTSGLKANNRYTTKSFSIAKIAYKYTHPHTFVEASITLTKDDRPREFIAAIKLLITNGQILDPKFALAPLKRDDSAKNPKLITTVDDVPVNFTHLGQYAFTSGNRIFEKKKDWKGANDHSKPKKAGHRDSEPQQETYKDPVVYFTIAISSDIPPHSLINGIRTEWEANGGGKLQVKDLQAQESARS